MDTISCSTFILCFLVVSVTCTIPVPDMDYSAYAKLGDINLGAIIPLHQYNISAPCGGNLRELGVLQRMEALAFAVDEINNRSDILPNVTLGYVILDDCYKESTAVGKALQFVTEKGSCAANTSSAPICGNQTASYDVIGIIGSESSANSMSIANVASLYKIPQLSYLATSPDLDNIYRFPYFFRVVPSDVHQAAAITDFLVHSNWTYVSIVYADSSYGVSGYEALQQAAREKGLCFASAQALDYSYSKEYYDEVIKKLARFENKARIVIVYTPLTVAKEILSAARRTGHRDTFTWLATDAWGRNIQDYEGLGDVAWGTIAVKTRSKNVARFDNHFANLVPSLRVNNPWFEEFWQDVFNCSSKVCKSTLSFSQSALYSPDLLTSLVFDAVYTYAHAIDDTVRKTCNQQTDKCYLNSCLTADVLCGALKKTSFRGEISKVQFDEKGNGYVGYIFQNLQKDGADFKLKYLAAWSRKSNLTLDGVPAQFRNFTTFPKSVCSDPCESGYSQEIQDRGCCWTCEPCRPNEISSFVSGIQKCIPCQNHTWPDPSKTMCLALDPTFLTFTSALGIALVSFAGLGVIATFLVAALYAANKNHKLIKASGRELSFVMLFGIWLHYSAVFVFILKPTDVMCIVNLCNFTLSFTLVYAPLLTKSNRIYRIFESGRRGRLRPPLIDTRSQLLITMVVILVKVLVLFVLIFLDSPLAVASMVTGNGDEHYLSLVCSLPMGAFGTCLGYNILLVFSCCFHAIKTRKLPTNYNESRFISFCVYTTILMWLAFLPAYVTISFGYYRTLFSCLALLMNATVFMVCLFGTRLYGVYFVKKSDLHLMSLASGAKGLKGAALAVKASVTLNHPGIKITPRRGSVQSMMNHSAETVETNEPSNYSEMEIVHIDNEKPLEKYEPKAVSIPEISAVPRNVSFSVIEGNMD